MNNTTHYATYALGSDPPRHVDPSRKSRPRPNFYKPRPPGPGHMATVGLRCGKAGDGNPSPSLALDSAFPRMNGRHPHRKGFSEPATPPTPSGAGAGQNSLRRALKCRPSEIRFYIRLECLQALLRLPVPTRTPPRASTPPVEQAIPTPPASNPWLLHNLWST